MNNKPKTPSRPAQNSPARLRKPVATNPLRAGEARWQRTVRYNWDNGGKRGGGFA